MTVLLNPESAEASKRKPKTTEGLCMMPSCFEESSQNKSKENEEKVLM